MSCQRYATAIADHACGADLAPDVAAHLTACPACAGLLVRQRHAISGLDNELQQMLAVEPSPFFVQRVQAQVHDSTSTRRMRGLWWAVAAVAAMVLIALLLTVDRQQPAAIQVQALKTPVAPTPTPSPAPRIDDRRNAATTEATFKRAPGTPSHRVVRTLPIAKAPEPEIQVQPGQKQAVDRYVALVRSGRLDTSSLEPKAEVDSTPGELVLGALEISPITVRELDGTTSSAVERRPQEEQRR